MANVLEVTTGCFSREISLVKQSGSGRTCLSLGQGGDSLTTLELRHFGGGGGGLLVNGEGPQRDFQYVGEGYGGGGDGSGGYGYGMQGVILMEVGP